MTNKTITLNEAIRTVNSYELNKEFEAVNFLKIHRIANGDEYQPIEEFLQLQEDGLATLEEKRKEFADSPDTLKVIAEMYDACENHAIKVRKAVALVKGAK